MVVTTPKKFLKDYYDLFTKKRQQKKETTPEANTPSRPKQDVENPDVVIFNF